MGDNIKQIASNTANGILGGKSSSPAKDASKAATKLSGKDPVKNVDPKKMIANNQPKLPV
jgi:hypothetical protein